MKRAGGEINVTVFLFFNPDAFIPFQGQQLDLSLS